VLDFDPAMGTFAIMPAYVTREEFEARVGVLEREVEGEKLVTRYILEQTRRNGDDLAAIKGRVDRVEEKIDALDRKVDALDRKFDALDQKVDSLVRNLPSIVADVMREVLRERDERS
jgi:CII-binding regulator of phage lambda lysogenization HflD